MVEFYRIHELTKSVIYSDSHMLMRYYHSCTVLQSKVPLVYKPNQTDYERIHEQYLY